MVDYATTWSVCESESVRAGVCMCVLIKGVLAAQKLFAPTCSYVFLWSVFRTHILVSVEDDDLFVVLQTDSDEAISKFGMPLCSGFGKLLPALFLSLSLSQYFP